MSKRVFYLVHDEARRRASQCVAEAPDGCIAEVREPNRNGAINAALHAKLGEIAERVQWAGAKHEIETWKRLLVGAWSRAQGEPVTMLPALDGNGIEIVFRRTSSMTQAEVHDLICYIEAWAAERPEFADEHA